MTPLAPPPSQPVGDGVLLTRSLEALRRRRRRVMGTKVLYSAFAGAIVSAQALAMAVGATAPATALWFGCALALAAVASVATAMIRTPSLRDIARTVDRRAALQDRAATALQFVGQDDDMARLVVSDASRRVAALDPVVVFPREYPARLRAIVGVALASTLLYSFAGARTSRSDLHPVSGGVGATGTGSPARAGDPAGRPRPGEFASAGSIRQESRVATGEGSEAARHGEVTPRGETSKPARGFTREAPAAARAGVITGLPPSGRGQQDPQRAAGSNASGRRDGGGAGTARAVRETSRRADARGAGGAGAGAVSLSAREGGGVKDGVLADDPFRRATARAPAAGGAYALEHEAAWRRAQAALAQDRVPPELRDYVRRYFTAIRTAKRP